MARRWFGKIITLGMMLLASPATADGGAMGLTIKQITVLGGQIFLWGDFPNPDSCASSAVAAAVPNDANRDMWLALATSAQLSRRKVTLWFDGCVYSPWFSTVPKLVAVTLEEH